MKRRAAMAVTAAAATLAAAANARAHGSLEGVGDFYAGLLHPVVAPAELVAIIAVGLLLGFCGPEHSRPGVAAFACGLLLGMAAGLAGAVSSFGAGLPLAAALRLIFAGAFFGEICVLGVQSRFR